MVLEGLESLGGLVCRCATPIVFVESNVQPVDQFAIWIQSGLNNDGCVSMYHLCRIDQFSSTMVGMICEI